MFHRMSLQTALKRGSLEFKKRLANSLRFVSLFAIGFYRCFLSGIFGGACRFHPSCSGYAQEAFTKLSWPRAFWLTLCRLAKCHPFGSSGYDPVPEPECHTVKEALHE